MTILAVPPSSHDVQAIAATMRIARGNEELRPRPSGLAVEVLDGPDAGLHQVEGEQLTCGRGPLCNIRLSDPSVSEFHFRLTVGTDEVLLEDLSSSNGLWIGRARVKRAHLLPGARFRAGTVRMRLSEIETTPSAIARGDNFFGLRGCSEAMRSLFALLARVAPTPLPMLVSGETGVGKGQLARAVHHASGRTGRFITVDCTALPHELADGLLFGHVKGSFTGAASDRPSPFEEANGGTLFLDEIGELPPLLQPKLLRALDEQVVQRLGSSTVRDIDVRLIAATNRHLVREISAGRFRSDLYHRLAGVAVQVPRLRDRREDIAFLASLFLEEASTKLERSIKLGPGVAEELTGQDWPGNIRQLRQTIFRAAYLSDGPEVKTVDLAQHGEDPDETLDNREQDTQTADPTNTPLQPLVDEFKRDYCKALLRRCSTAAEAARIAGYTSRGFRTMLSKLGLDAQEFLKTKA